MKFKAPSLKFDIMYPMLLTENHLKKADTHREQLKTH